MHKDLKAFLAYAIFYWATLLLFAAVTHGPLNEHVARSWLVALGWAAVPATGLARVRSIPAAAVLTLTAAPGLAGLIASAYGQHGYTPGSPFSMWWISGAFVFYASLAFTGQRIVRSTFSPSFAVIHLPMRAGIPRNMQR